MEPTPPVAGVASSSATLAACFISYARPDAEHAIGLTRALTTRGHDCWCDVQDLIPGARWQDDIEDALIRCDLVIFLLSPRSLASPGCAGEIRMALELGKKIIPIQIAAIEDRSPSLYSDISTFQWIVPIDLTDADAIVARIVEAGGIDLTGARLLRDILLLARRSHDKAVNIVLLSGQSLRDAEQALAMNRGLGPVRMGEALAYLAMCRAAEQARARRRTITIAVVIAALATVAATAVIQWRLAVARERDNRAAFLASEASATLREPWLFTSWSSNARRAALLLVNAMNMGVNRRYLDGSLELGGLLRAMTERNALPEHTTVAVSDDRQTLAFSAEKGAIFIQRIDGPATRVATIGEDVRFLTFDPTGSRLGVVDTTDRAFIVDLSQSPPAVQRLPIAGAWRLAIVGTRVAVAHDGNGLSIGDLSMNRWTRVSTKERVSALSIDPRTLETAAGTDDGLLLTIGRDPRRPRTQAIGQSAIQHIARRADGTIVAVAGSSGVFHFPPNSDAPVLLDLPIRHGVTGLAVDESMSLLAVAAWDEAIHVWDWEDRRETARLPSPARDVEALFFDPAHRLHAIEGARHWQWDPARRVPRLRVPCNGPLGPIKTAHDHVWLKCGAEIKHVHTGETQWRVSSLTIPTDTSWLVTNGATAMTGGLQGVFTLRAGRDGITMADVSGSVPLRKHAENRGELVTGATSDGREVVVWNMRTATIAHREPTRAPVVALGVASLADVMFFCDDTGVCVRRQFDGKGSRHTRATGLTVTGVTVDPRGVAAVIAADREARIWSPSRGTWLGLPDEGVSVFASGFLLNGERFFVSRDHVHVYDVRTGLLAGLLQHRGEVQAGAVALDEGLLLLTVGFEKIGRLWDARSLSEVARFSTPDTYPHGAYEITPDRFILWTTRQAIDIWDISEDWLRQTLCGGTLGGLDDQAWQRVGIDPASADKCAPR